MTDCENKAVCPSVKMSIWFRDLTVFPATQYSAEGWKGIMSRSQPCLGIFTDHPENITKLLPRPKTPFVPPPDNQYTDGDDFDEFPDQESSGEGADHRGESAWDFSIF
jgi:hypothetical protein